MLSKIRKHSNVLVILSFVILAWLSMVLLASTHSLMGTGDMPMHLHQLREIQLALNHHELVYYGLNEFHGSTIMTLYPWLNLWPVAVLADIVRSKVMVVYLFFALNEVVVFLISYFSSLNFSRSRQISYLFSVFYGLSTLYLDYGFADMDWGELLTMTFLPLVIFGSIALLQHGDWLELSAGMTLIISSHVLSTLIITAFLIVFFILNIFKFKLKIIINLCKASLLTTITSIIIWLPAYKVLRFNNALTTPPRFKLYGTPFRQIVGGAIKGEVTYGISFFALGGIVLGAWYFLRLDRYMKQFYIISVLTVILCSAWFKWWYLMPSFVSSFQFTWRLYLIPELGLSYICAAIMVSIIKKWPKGINIIAILGLLLITLSIQLEGQQRLIQLNGKAPSLNINYLARSDKPYFQGYGNDHKDKIRYYTTHMPDHPHGTIKTPQNYRINGNCSYESLFSQRRFLKTAPHYWPEIAKLHFNDINNHWIRSRQGLQSHLYNNGYNHFTFKTPQVLTNAFLPLLNYNHERLSVKLDGHLIRHRSRQNVLFVSRLPKGSHELSVNVQKDKVYYVSCVTLVAGILIYLMLIVYKSRALLK